MMNARCAKGGHDLGYNNDDGHVPPSNRCSQCPPVLCDQCGELDHIDALCKCWRSVADIPLADLKGLFAGSGLSLDIRGGSK